MGAARTGLWVAVLLGAGCVCGPEASTPDAGRSDAGPSDAGRSDAGLSDAGASDAGRSDAGLSDAGPFDAGLADAGLADAGLADAGLADAGLADGGIGDAGVSDAGLSDAGVSDAGAADAGVSDAGPPDSGTDAGTDAGPTITDPRDSGEVVLDSGLPWSWAPVGDLINTPPSDAGVSGRWVSVLPTAAFRAWAGGVLLPDGGVVAIPYNESTVLVIHPSDDSSTRWPITGGAVPGGWVGGVLLPDGTVIGIPGDAPRFLRIDPAAGTAVQFGDDLADAGPEKFRGGVLGLNGQVYAAPLAANFIARLDPATGVVTRLPLPSSRPRGNTHSAVLFPTGDIVMFPAVDSPGILIVPSRDGGLDARWSLPVPPLPGTAYFGGGSVITGVDTALAPPQQNVRPLEYRSGLLGWGRAVDGLAPLSANNFFYGAWSTDGHHYALPYGEQSVLRMSIDPDAGVMRSLDAGVLSFGAVLGSVGLPDGRIIGIPHGQSAWLEVTPEGRRTVPMETMTSPYLNKL